MFKAKLFLLLSVVLILFMVFLLSGCDTEKEDNLTLEIEVEGPGEVSGRGIYPEGEEVTVEATPDERQEFIGWHKDGEKVSSNLNYHFEINQDTRFKAVFEDKESDNEVTEEYFTLEIDVEGPGEVKIKDPEELSEKEAFSKSREIPVLEGEKVTLKAIPDEGNKLVSWRVGESSCHISSEPKYRTFEIVRDNQLAAIFVSKDIYKETETEKNKGDIQFTCPILKEVIQRKLNKKVITKEDMRELENIEIVNMIEVETELQGDLKSSLHPIGSLEGLQYAENLVNLFMVFPGRDLSPLSELDNLKEIRIQNISCNLKDLSPISDLEKLEILDTGWTAVEDISPVSTLDSLKELRITTTKEINDISPLSNLNQLEVLQLSTPSEMAAGISSTYNISSLSGLEENLKVLKLDGNIIKDEDNLSNFTNLEVLSLGRCDINEFSFLSELRNLESLERIDLRDTELNRKAMKYIKELKEEGVKVHYTEHLAPKQ